MSDLLKPGQIFAERYRIDRYLAEGGMGAVFVAEQIATELKVAIKVLWPNVLTSKNAVEQFQLEARIAARVPSEHIVKILDAGLDKETGNPFLVMELLNGAPLEDIVNKKGPFSANEVVTMLKQIALGLDKAHGYIGQDGVARPIVHRDLKPENLFLTTRESGEPHVKILDFGLAKVLSESAAVSQEMKGTPLYMAFEQATGERITPQTDIWALGLIAFFLLTGRVYWATANKEDAGISALFSEILSLPMAPASERLSQIGGSSNLPQGFNPWLEKCIDRNPAARFTSAGEAAEALAMVVSTGRLPGTSAVSSDEAMSATALPPTLVSAGVPLDKTAMADSAAISPPTLQSAAPPAAVTKVSEAPPAAGSVPLPAAQQVPVVTAVPNQAPADFGGSNIAVASTHVPSVPTHSKTPLIVGATLAVVGLAAVGFMALRPAPAEEAPEEPPLEEQAAVAPEVEEVPIPEPTPEPEVEEAKPKPVKRPRVRPTPKPEPPPAPAPIAPAPKPAPTPTKTKIKDPYAGR